MGGILQEGSERRQTGVSAAGAVVAFLLQMIEEVEDQSGVKIDQRQCGRGLADTGLSEAEQQSERVAVGGDGARADGSLMAQVLMERGYKIVSGGTENHMFLLDLIDKGITGKEAEAVLGSAHMTINKNAIPNDPEKPMVTSGIRIGTPAMTTRGFKDEEARMTANLIADVLDNPRDAANIETVRAKVNALTARFPVYK